MSDGPVYPGGHRFAFTVMDDTDVSTLENVRPVYRLLEELGFRTTKTVWPLACPEGSRDFADSDTLDDPDYAAFVEDLAVRGFEIAGHGATMESSRRDRTERGIARLRRIVPEAPLVYANHAFNREGLYWGAARLDDPLLRALYRRALGVADDHFQGEHEGSEFFWGDLCREHVGYVRNLTFDDLDLSAVNPSMPYRDPRRPCVRWWFSACDAEDVDAFNRLLAPARQQRLERSGGWAIVATHFGKGFARGGEVDPTTRSRLESLAARPGWFCTVSELLDFLRTRRSQETLPAAEWRRMQWRWLWQVVQRRLARR